MKLSIIYLETDAKFRFSIKHVQIPVKKILKNEPNKTLLSNKKWAESTIIYLKRKLRWETDKKSS